jgi:redox-sensitive bicupin YhaK (pirin superfamily)
MIILRKSHHRGHFDHGWLDTYHTFSFGDYHDPAHMGFSVLRVINEDKISPNQGFGMHPHRNMEIITYVIDGALAHQDSMGNTAIINAGEIQRMSAGTGVHHAEFNPLPNQTSHLLQIWILPNQRGNPPSYDQKKILLTPNALMLIAAHHAIPNGVSLNQDVNLYLGKTDKVSKINYSPLSTRKLWLQLIKGTLLINTILMEPGDGAAITDDEINLETRQPVEFLLFDLP